MDVTQELMPKLFCIRRGLSRINGMVVWRVTLDTRAGWPWPSTSAFFSWAAAMEYVEDMIDEYSIPELKRAGYSIRRDWDDYGLSEGKRDTRPYYVCRHDARVRSKRRKMVKALGERAAWRAAWKHYKGAI